MNIYSKDTLVFTNNGYGFLTNSITAHVTEVLNGEYSLIFTYPIGGALAEYIIKENLIKVNVGNDNLQIFRIKLVESDDKIMRVYALHIFYDLSDNFLTDVAPDDLNCTDAMEWILARTQYANSYTVYSDIITTNTQRYVRRNPIEAIMGDLENSMLKQYDAELERDNTLIRMLLRRGSDNNIKVMFGKNIQAIKIKDDLTSVYTRVMPIASNGLLLPELFIDSPIIGDYLSPKIGKVPFDDIVYDPTDETAFQDLEDVYTEMRDRVDKLYSNFNLDKPRISITVSWLELSKVKEYYEKYSALETVNLGDTVKVEYKGFLYETRIVKTIYNVLLDKIDTFDMGIVQPSFTNTTNVAVSNINEVLRDPINILEQAKTTASSLITSAMGGYVVKTNNELFIMDTDDIETSQKVWRWNLEGLGYSSNGINGDFEIAMTSSGGIVADFITTGVMNVGRIDGLSTILDGIQSNIGINADGIQLNVNQITSLNETTSTLEVDLAGVQATLLNKGGYNLIQNSVKQFDNEGYTGTFPNFSDTDTINNLMSKSAIKMMNGTDSITFAVPNGDYNYSTTYKKLLSPAVCTITVNGTLLTLTELDWSVQEHNFSVTDNTIVIEYTSSDDDSALLGDVLMILGTEKQVWTPNPNEIYTDTVKISRGIEVSSNTSNTKLLANTDGTRIINILTDEVTSEFTDKGTRTKKLEAEEAIIAGLLISDLVTQTWLSRT